MEVQNKDVPHCVRFTHKTNAYTSFILLHTPTVKSNICSVVFTSCYYHSWKPYILFYISIFLVRQMHTPTQAGAGEK